MTNEFVRQVEHAVTSLLQKLRPNLMSYYGNAEFTLKNDKSVVTELDRQTEEQLKEVLRKLDPGIGFEGEELGKEGSRQTYWLIDPIDGTEQFIRGIPSCKTAICLVDNSQVVWSLIYYFVRDELYLARHNKGATCNGEKIQATFRSLNQAWIDISVNLFNSSFLPKLLEVRKHIAGFSIARDISLVFTGKLDGLIVFESEGGPWDYAPRSLLCKEAGMQIANFGNDTYDLNDKNFMVAHPRNFETLMKLLS